MNQKVFENVGWTNVVSAVLLVCGVGLLFTSRYRLSIFFVTALILYQLLQQIIRAGVTELSFNLPKGTVSAKMLEKKQDLKQDLGLTVSDGVQVTEEISEKVQESIDEAFLFGYKAAGGRGEISGVSIEVKDGQKTVSWTES